MIYLIIAVSIGGYALLSAVLFWFMPCLTRHDLYFAVTVAPGFRRKSEAKSILRRYRVELVFLSAFALVTFVSGITWLGIGFVSVGFFLQLIASFIAFYRARERVQSYAVPPTMVREVDLHARVQIIPGGWLAASGPFILLAAFTGYLWAHGGETLPRFSRHWSGWQQNNLAAHSLSIYLLTRAGILVVFTLFLYGLTHWVRSVHAAGPEAAHELKFRRTVATVTLVAEYFIILQSFWLLLVPRQTLAAVALLPLTFLLVLAALVVLANLGQGGNRVPITNSTRVSASAVPVGDRTLDRYWKLGVFYFNPNDSAVLIEKRFGLGYTLNFARPIAWIILLLLLMLPLVPVLAHLSRFLP
jgi:uncharacterized membrane protein